MNHKYVVVYGSKNSGKTTLIKSIIKHSLDLEPEKVSGPITINFSKKQRIQIQEANEDLSLSME